MTGHGGRARAALSGRVAVSGLCVFVWILFLLPCGDVALAARRYGEVGLSDRVAFPYLGMWLGLVLWVFVASGVYVFCVWGVMVPCHSGALWRSVHRHHEGLGHGEIDPSVYGGASGPVRFGIVPRQAFPVVIGVLVCVVCFGDVWCVGGMVFCGRVTYAGFMPWVGGQVRLYLQT